jgi:actin related protein 2/3 complex subunit 1A/1B
MQHDLVVSALDWSAANDKIVSCSHDRNAFVWSYNAAERKWVPALVILRIDRAALDVRWSLDGKKFAVASGAKCVSICTYEKSSDWCVEPSSIPYSHRYPHH